MYPLESIYGAVTYRAFERDKAFKGGLKGTRQSSKQVSKDVALIARSYAELVNIVSFLTVMSKSHTLYFCGQSQDWALRPAIFRMSWTSLKGNRHSISNSPVILDRIWNHLNGEISSIVLSVCEKLPMPRRNTLTMFREAVWAVAQHYDLWPTPLIDITPSLRIAASFALWDGQSNDYVYVVALSPSTNSVTYDSDQHVVLACLQAVCPPVAKRPHYHDGFLVGRFPILSPASNSIDKNPNVVPNLACRLVARINLRDADDEASREARRPSGSGFWSDDFPRMSKPSLMPKATDDELLEQFSKYGTRIDEAMHQICKA